MAITIRKIACPEPPVGATLMKTGQTTSYRTGDDGDLQEGRATDFFTLAVNNPFGNTNRFTDELGGTAYSNDIVIDWSTYNGSSVLGYYIGDSNTARNWNDSIDWALALSVGTFTSGWRLPNFREIANICNASSTSLLNYAPFNKTVALWTSTCFGFTAIICVPQITNIQASNINQTYRTYAVRTFTVTGTTLT